MFLWAVRFVQNAFYVNIIHHCVAFILAFAVRIKFSFMLPCLQSHEKFLEDVLRVSELSENVVSDAHYNIDHIVFCKSIHVSNTKNLVFLNNVTLQLRIDFTNAKNKGRIGSTSFPVV